MTLLHHEVIGTGDSVLLLYGLGLDLSMWDDQVPALSARSPAIAAPCSHGEQLKALLDFLDGLR